MACIAVTMHGSPSRWWLWWACLAAAAALVTDQGHCEVLDLSLQPSAYPLPTNLTVRPLATGWHLNLTLQEKGAPPAACVRLKETDFRVQVMFFKGDCVYDDIQKYDYLPGASVPPHEWTTLALDIINNTIFVIAPDSDPVPLKAISWSLPHDTLQVTMAQDVEAAVGCHVNCPLYRHTSGGQHAKKKIGEWDKKKLHFYFRPGTNFSKVHYQAVCKMRQEPFRQGFDIQPGKNDAERVLNLVELEQREKEVDLYLNRKLLHNIQLPNSCNSSMHVIWTVGDALFGFECEPEQVIENGGPVNEDTPNNLMHPGVAAGITTAVFLIAIVIGIIIYTRIDCRCKTTSTPNKYELTPTTEQPLATNGLQTPPSPREEVPSVCQELPATNVPQALPSPREEVAPLCQQPTATNVPQALQQPRKTSKPSLWGVHTNSQAKVGRRHRSFSVGTETSAEYTQVYGVPGFRFRMSSNSMGEPTINEEARRSLLAKESSSESLENCIKQTRQPHNW